MITLTLLAGSASTASPATASGATRIDHEHRRPHDEEARDPDAQPTDGWVLADAFDRAAPSYDAMVALSPGYHDQLRRPPRPSSSGCRDPSPAPTRSGCSTSGCGSGASTRAVLDAWAARGGRGDGHHLQGVDASEGMVAQARAKSVARRRRALVSDAVAHLETLADAARSTASSPLTCCATCPTASASCARSRVLRPGGALVIHDYSVAGSLRGPGDLGGGVPRRHHPAGGRSSGPTCR